MLIGLNKKASNERECPLGSREMLRVQLLFVKVCCESVCDTGQVGM